ncbi:Transport and Golgi organization protein 2 [Sphaceloma murrayae]|uniref:Transport and Golgi organization protein 2 n=1 Tax=Sphaceloma murrayae TaxID=2082308 RepID=A0A2K1QFH1_9PEZI|nr:Transport and Golgi organization protein 2 [Sphaceloma murrayae]
MCIALLTTAHPAYALILASNRDEFVSRPTAQADWWDQPNQHVLGGRDLQREIRGTWLGITRQGRIGCLTNFREKEGQPVSGLKSRGGIVNAFLTTPADSQETTTEAAKRIVEVDGVDDVGGFSLLFGRLRRPSNDGQREGLAIISNRTPDVDGVIWVGQGSGEVHGLSNSHFGDTSWPKVTTGEKMLAEAVREHAGEADATRDSLVDRLFQILSVDTLPKRQSGEDWDAYVLQLRNSIFIPKVGGQMDTLASDEVHASDLLEKVESKSEEPDLNGVYATQKQTIILVDHDGNVIFREKTLHTKHGNSNDGTEDMRTFEFQIQGW